MNMLINHFIIASRAYYQQSLTMTPAWITNLRQFGMGASGSPLSATSSIVNLGTSLGILFVRPRGRCFAALLKLECWKKWFVNTCNTDQLMHIYSDQHSLNIYIYIYIYIYQRGFATRGGSCAYPNNCWIQRVCDLIENGLPTILFLKPVVCTVARSADGMELFFYYCFSWDGWVCRGFPPRYKIESEWMFSCLNFIK